MLMLGGETSCMRGMGSFNAGKEIKPKSLDAGIQS
jgi:hypothetical protein